MSRIVIGKSGDKDASLDVKALLRTHLLIWASTGGGKSYLLRRIAEQLFGKVPIIIVDREGDFSTLREKFGFVLVGPNGETPADPRSAKLVIERLLEMRASAVCDLFELGIEARHEWVKNAYEALVNAPKRLWGPTAIILDEAHSFAPEKGQGESIAYGAVTDFNSVARKRGFGSIFATQRLSKLSKNATAEMYNQAAGPTARQADRDRAAYEMGISGRQEIKDFSETLRVLEPGFFCFQGRAISMERIFVSVGQVQTTHGSDSSGRYTAKAPPTPAEVKKMLPKLADLPKQAEEKAKTEAEFKKQIRSLESQLRSRPAETREVQVADPKAIARALRPLQEVLGEAMKVLVKLEAIGFNEASIKPEEVAAALAGTAKEIARLAKAGLSKRVEEFENLKRETNRMLARMKKVLESQDVVIDLTVKHNEPFTVAAPPIVKRPQIFSDSQNASELPPGELAVLKAVAQYSDGAERDQLSVLTGYKRSSRDAYLARLKTKVFVEEKGARIFATQAGVDALGSDYELLPTGAELRKKVLTELPEGEKKILQILIEYGGSPVAREALDETAGYKRSSRDAYIARLTARRLVEQVGRGEVKASANLF